MHKLPEKHKLFRLYKKLREEILKFYKDYLKEFNGINCRKGCTKCCETFGILPIEYYYLKQQIEKNNIQVIKTNNSCPFLKDGICQIYKFRPIMCITQGLPLLISGGDEPPNILLCDLNNSITNKDGLQRITIFKYDEIVVKMTAYNILFCNEFKFPYDRIDISKLVQTPQEEPPHPHDG